MTQNPHQPRNHDAVLGGQSVPTGSVFLSGIESVKNCLTDPSLDVRIAALHEALEYGEEGLDLVVQTLHEANVVRQTAYDLLESERSSRIRAEPYKSNPVIAFADPNLEKAIRIEIGVTDAESLTVAALSQITELRLQRIEKLDEIEWLTNLTELYLWESQIIDVTPLAGSTNLTELDLSDNQIRNVTPLAKLDNLTRLHLYGNPIRNFFLLDELLKLEDKDW